MDMKGENREMANLTESACGLSAAALSSDPKLRQNNFHLLRFLFAFIVFLVHTYILSGAESLTALRKFLFPVIAVKSFYVVSGFLIFMNYENSRDIHSYFIKRIRRIYPAYLFIIMACAVLGSVVSTYALGDYFSLQLLKLISANLLFLNFLQPNLPGPFEGDPLQPVNGVLWILKIEAMLFIVGAAGYYYLQYLAKYAAWFVAVAIAVFVLQSWLPWVAVQSVALDVLIVDFACVIPCLGNFDKYGDFSYGICIVHFPILQILIAYGLFKESPWTVLLVSIALVMSSAFMLWHFIEKPFLRKPSHYVAENYG